MVTYPTGELTIDKFASRGQSRANSYLTNGKIPDKGWKMTGWNAPRVVRWAGVIGFVLPALTLATYPIWMFPGTQIAGDQLARWSAGNHGRLTLTMMLNTVGVTTWLVFGAALYAVLRDRLPERSLLPACFAASFGGCVVLLLSGFTAFNLLLYRDRSGEMSIMLYDLTFGLLAMSGMLTVVALGSYAAAVYGYRVMPRYTAHLALAGAVTHPLLLATFVVREGPLSLEGGSITAMPAFLFAWIIGTATAMPRRVAPPR
ncbi:hypothetical protein O6072_01145 [Mycolicibacterium neoaurum]|uniref:hypothetical protein n=1 Tax=Mycolicibacterium neoaurum TaxID=1795 RepID=UPI00248CD812|nr:hypothetical protein [Mycolicibacterium neoaurum]WBP95173.1 hypothetical protein O7W24_02975 [Mycolicibacterium neoaurum]WBS08529.1 hypothetical protein O6072_01145 [Mycolicibacterium neoaurum]